jgi:hypothetical protein
MPVRAKGAETYPLSGAFRHEAGSSVLHTLAFKKCATIEHRLEGDLWAQRPLLRTPSGF